MTDFREARYIYTQDENDDRGIAWTQYVVSKLVARDPANPASTFASRTNNFNSRTILDDGRTVADLFILKNNTPGTRYEFSPVFIDFLTRTAYYHFLLTLSNIKENKYAKNFYEHFSNAPKNIQEIYLKIFNAVRRSDRVIISLAEPNIASNFSNYGIGLANNFKKMIPKLHINIANLLKKPDGNAAGREYLQNLYQNIVDATALPVGMTEVDAAEMFYNNYVKVKPGTSTVFPNLYPRKYYGNKWKNLGNVSGMSHKYESENDIYYDSLIKINKWFRNSKGEYYKYNEETDKPELVPEPIQNDNCYGLNLDSSNCTKFLDILFNSDENSKQAFQDLFNDESQKNFWPDIQKEINNIHPKTALLILQKFGFKINPLNQQVRSVSYWLEHNVKQYFGQNDDQLTSVIRKNERLLRFLELLVHFINYNPGILNPEFMDVSDNISDFIEKNMTDFAIKMHLKPARMHFRSLDEVFEYMRRNKYNYARRIGLNGQRFFPIFGAVRGLNVGVPSGIMFGGSQNGGESDMRVQVGGQHYIYQLQPFTTSRRDAHGHSYLKNLFEQLKSELARRNKTLNQKDVENIRNQIRNLEIYEKRLYRTLSTIKNYVNNSSYSYGNKENVKLADMEMYASELSLNGMKYQTQEEKIMNTLDMLLKHFKSDREDEDRDIQSSDYGYTP